MGFAGVWRRLSTLDALRAIIKPLNDKLDREQNIAGSEYYNGILIYEENVRIKAARDNSRAQLALKQLTDLDRQRGGNPSPKKEPPKTQ